MVKGVSAPQTLLMGPEGVMAPSWSWAGRVVTMAVHARLTLSFIFSVLKWPQKCLSLGHTYPEQCIPHPGRTLCREKVLTQKVASSMVSSRVTWMKP